jgi:hypothetical protein
VPDHPAHAPTEFQADLRDLGGLARARLPRDHHDLVVPDGRGDLVPPLADREFFRVRDRRYGGAPAGQAGLGRADLVGQTGGVRPLTGSVEEPPEPVLVAQRQPGEAAAEFGDARW